MAFVAGNAALALGCFGGFHVLLDATPRRASWIRDAIVETRLPREFANGRPRRFLVIWSFAARPDLLAHGEIGALARPL